MPPYEQELLAATAAAQRAAEVILRHYRAGQTGWQDKADGSPVTEVDLAANAEIEATLRAAFPGDAILSEETPEDEDRLQARLGCARVWIIDPLDGTRGFLARTDDFCVHVALAVNEAPVVGVVLRPVSGTLYSAVAGQGAFCVGPQSADVGPQPLRVSSRRQLSDLRLGISRHNAPATLLAWLDASGLTGAALRTGASTKYTALAEGALDGVVTITRGEKEWDTCAPEIIVREAGGVVSDGDGRPLRYNQRQVDRPRGIVASNGLCQATLLEAVAPFLT